MTTPSNPPEAGGKNAGGKNLLTLDEAVAQMLAAVAAPADAVAGDPAAGAIEWLDTFDALGRVLAQDLTSTVDVPPLDNSAMDGYALRGADVPEAGAVLPVSQRIPAGSVGHELQPGTAARIFTGAPVPAGADAVVMQEQCEALAEGDAGASGPSVKVLSVPRLGQNIRRRGEDIASGSVVLRPGSRLSPQALGVAASAGLARVPVWRRPRVALFSTGDELTMPGQPLKPGGIYNSNRYTLRGLIQAAGGECIDLGIVADTLDATRAALREAASRADLIVSSGGVSVGEEDHIKPAVQAEGTLALWQLAIKPGKPLAFGRVGLTPFVGLPGNPVASFISYLVAVLPLVRKLAGLPAETPVAHSLRADFDWPKPDRSRREFLRARRNPQGGVELFAHQGSGVLTSVVWADGLVDLAPSQAVQRGDVVRFLAFSEMGLT
jgi:molybdopterin molybdotransferase